MSKSPKQTLVIVHDAGADADDMTAIYFLATQAKNLDITLVFGANKDCSAAASKQYLAEQNLEQFAKSRGLPWSVSKRINFEEFVTQEIECDFLLNISPWHAASKWPEDSAERAEISAALPNLSIKQFVLSQGDFRGTPEAFNCDDYNQPFFTRYKTAGKLISVPASECAGPKSMPPTKKFMQEIPPVAKEFIILNAMRNLLSRAPSSLMRFFNPLGLCYAGEKIGRGANYTQARGFYNNSIRKAGELDFDHLVIAAKHTQLATSYFRACIHIAKALPAEKQAQRLAPMEGKEDAIIGNIARMCASYELAFPGIWDGKDTVFQGLEPTVAVFKEQGLDSYLDKFAQCTEKNPAAYACLYDLIAAFTMKQSIEALRDGQSVGECVSAALGMDRNLMLQEITREISDQSSHKRKQNSVGGGGAKASETGSLLLTNPGLTKRSKSASNSADSTDPECLKLVRALSV